MRFKPRLTGTATLRKPIRSRHQAASAVPTKEAQSARDWLVCTIGANPPGFLYPPGGGAGFLPLQLLVNKERTPTVAVGMRLAPLAMFGPVILLDC